jgi:hypothetical protein
MPVLRLMPDMETGRRRHTVNKEARLIGPSSFEPDLAEHWVLTWLPDRQPSTIWKVDLAPDQLPAYLPELLMVH